MLVYFSCNILSSYFILYCEKDGGIDMKTTKVVHLGSSKIFLMIRENFIIVIFTLFFIFGVLLACVLFDNNCLIKEAGLLTNFFVTSKSDNTFIGIFLSSFLLSFSFLFIVYLFGTSLLGIAFIPVIVSLRGFIIGLLLSDLYSSGTLNALIINLLTIIPGAIVSVLALICASSRCLNLSYSLGKLSIGDGQALHKIDIKRYLSGFSILAFVTIVSALFEAFMSIAFRNFFDFG